LRGSPASAASASAGRSASSSRQAAAPPSPHPLLRSSPPARSLACFVSSDWAGGFRGGKRIGGQLELAGLGFASGSQIRWVLGSPRWLGGYFSLEGSGANWDELCCCVLAIPLADLGSGFRWTGGLFGRADICGFWRLLARHLSVFLRMSSEFWIIWVWPRMDRLTCTFRAISVLFAS